MTAIMRPVVYSVAASLDGFIAGKKGEYDWIPTDEKFDWVAYMDRFDTVLMGRRTYELVASQQQDGAALPKLPTFVFSRTPNDGIICGAGIFWREVQGGIHTVGSAMYDDLHRLGAPLLNLCPNKFLRTLK